MPLSELLQERKMTRIGRNNNILIKMFEELVMGKVKEIFLI